MDDKEEYSLSKIKKGYINLPVDERRDFFQWAKRNEMEEEKIKSLARIFISFLIIIFISITYYILWPLLYYCYTWMRFKIDREYSTFLIVCDK
jgi:hypothetical protein